MKTETLEQCWSLYMAAFGTVSHEQRERLLEKSVSEDVVFTNPGGEGNSRAGLNSHIEKFQSVNPGAYFTTDKVYAQHDKLLAVWSMYKGDGTRVATGYNFVRSDRDGRLSYMVGFF